MMACTTTAPDELELLELLELEELLEELLLDELELLLEELELDDEVLPEELELEELDEELELLELELDDEELEVPPALVTRKRRASNSRVPSVSRISTVLLLPASRVAVTGANSDPAGRGLAVEVVDKVATRTLFTHKLMARVPVDEETVR